MAKIFLSNEKRTIGRIFSVGPFGFPGFCRVVRMPFVSALGYIPVLATSFSIDHLRHISSSHSVSTTHSWVMYKSNAPTSNTCTCGNDNFERNALRTFSRQ